METGVLANNEELDTPVRRSGQNRRWIHGITIEPVLFAVFLAQVMSDAVLTELVLKRTCEVDMMLNQTVCDSLGSDTVQGHDAEEIVQPNVAYFFRWKSGLQNLFPAVLALFLGPWSDRFGRKPVIACALVGCSLMYTVLFALAFFNDLPPGWLLSAIVPLALMGGQLNMTSACACFISDITPQKDRSFRMAILESVIQLAQLVGSPLAGLIFSNWKIYEINFGISALVVITALMYLLCFVDESVTIRENTTKKWKNLIDLNHPKQVWLTCTKLRHGHGRSIIFLCAAVLGSFIFILEGEAQIAFLFVRLQFGWDLQYFTSFGAVSLAIIVVGTLVGCWLLPKWFKNSDAYLTLFSFSADIVNNILRAVATRKQDYFMYIGSALSVFKGVVSPAIRSILSKTVPAEDLGKVFALTFSLENILPIVAGQLFITVYNASIPSMPGAAYLLSAGIYCIDFICILIVAVIQNKFRNDEQ